MMVICRRELAHRRQIASIARCGNPKGLPRTLFFFKYIYNPRNFVFDPIEKNGSKGTAYLKEETE